MRDFLRSLVRFVMSDTRNRIKNAELLSLAGACIASVGLGAVLGAKLGAFWPVLLVAGVAIHAAGMFRRRRLEQSGNSQQTRWENFLYWACWVVIFLLVAYLIAASLVAA